MRRLGLLGLGLSLALVAPVLVPTTAVAVSQTEVVAWGHNGSGQSAAPSGLTGVAQLAAGGDHSLALKSDRTVVAWGSNEHGQSTVPSGLTDVTAVAAGWWHSIALKSDGTVVAWGHNVYAQSTVNRPGVSGDSKPWEGWSHVREHT